MTTRKSLNRFVVGTESETWSEHSAIVEVLRSRHLLKTLSLVLADLADVKVPAFLLLLGKRLDLIKSFADRWGYPLMVRMDYRRSPPRKPLGGIPLRNFEAVVQVCEYLFAAGCFPLFHPHIDRFKDLASAGILLRVNATDSDIEIVGKGFDAGDLRLGKASPHETLTIDLMHGTVKRRTVIAQSTYEQERRARAETTRKLQAYTEFANKSGRLLADLTQFEAKPSEIRPNIPYRYTPMPRKQVDELIGLARVLESKVISRLPRSTVYVASFSRVQDKSWVLWDVYGDWYKR